MNLSLRALLLNLILLTATNVGADPGLALVLEKQISREEASKFDLQDPVRGDIKSMDRCFLPDGKEVTAVRDGEDSGDVVTIDNTIRLSIPHTEYWGWQRIALGCDPVAQRWFHGHTVDGTVTAYSATGAQLWQVQLQPFHAVEHRKFRSTKEFAGKHILTTMQVRGNYLLIEWAPLEGRQYFAVLTTDGKLVEQFGPTNFLLRTAATETGRWQLLWGESPKLRNFVPTALYSLRMTENPAPDSKPAIVSARLDKSANQDRRIASKLPATPMLDHMLALLWSPRAKNLDFCTITSPESAHYWLGRDYDPDVAARARRALLSLWIARANDLATRGLSAPDGPINQLFQERSATDPQLKKLFGSMDPTDPAWDAAFRPKALAILRSLPELEQAPSGAVVHPPSP